MRESSESTITIEGISHDVFLCVLAFLYTGKARDIAPDMALEVMGAAAHSALPQAVPPLPLPHLPHR